MARIIYGVSGQGFGHSTRSREVLSYLKEQGHDLMVFTYDQGLFFLEKDFKTFEVPGLGLIYKNNKLQYWHTILRNIKQVAKQSRHWNKILNTFRDFKPDLVITDFEPLTVLLAKLMRLPLISLDNQHQITNTKISLPLKYRKDLMAVKLVIKSMVWGANYYVVTSFFRSEVKRKDTAVFESILRQEIFDLKPIKGDFILLYQTAGFEKMIDKIKALPYRFVVFGFNKEMTDGNIEYKEYSHKEWLQYLASCRAIVATAGLSLISEAIYLNKPYFAIPVKKQIEQVINAYYLEKMGCGVHADVFDLSKFVNFMDNLPKYEAKLVAIQQKDNSALLAKLSELIAELTAVHHPVFTKSKNLL
ncbi:MAG: MJ1255/VC2487 family glycosyltransferase [bacterium]